MIWSVLIDGIVWVLNLLFSWLPKASDFPLPHGIQESIVLAIGYWNRFLEVFWLLDLPWTLTLWYFGILVILMTLRLVRIIR